MSVRGLSNAELVLYIQVKQDKISEVISHNERFTEHVKFLLGYEFEWWMLQH